MSFTWSLGNKPFSLSKCAVIKSPCPEIPSQVGYLLSFVFFNPKNSASITLRSTRVFENEKDAKAVLEIVENSHFEVTKNDEGDEYVLSYGNPINDFLLKEEILVEFTEMKQRENFLRSMVIPFQSTMKKEIHRIIDVGMDRNENNEPVKKTFEGYSLTFPKPKPQIVLVGEQNGGKSTIVGMMIESPYSHVSDFKCCTFYPVKYEYSLEKFVYVTSEKFKGRDFVAERGSSYEQIQDALCKLSPEDIPEKGRIRRKYGEKDVVIHVGFDSEILKKVTIIDTAGTNDSDYQKSVLEFCASPNSIIVMVSSAIEHNLDEVNNDGGKEFLSPSEFVFVTSLIAKIQKMQAESGKECSESLNNRLIFVSNKCHKLLGGREQYVRKKKTYGVLGMKRKKFNCPVSSTPKPTSTEGSHVEINENDLLEKHRKKLEEVEMKTLKQLREDRCLGRNFSEEDVFAVSISPDVFGKKGDLSGFEKVIDLYGRRFRSLVTRILQKVRNAIHVDRINRYFGKLFSDIRTSYDMVVNEAGLEKNARNVMALCELWLSDDKEEEFKERIVKMMEDKKREFKESICRLKNLQTKKCQVASEMIQDCVQCCVNNQIQQALRDELNDFVERINRTQSREYFTVNTVSYPRCCQYRALSLKLFFSTILMIPKVIIKFLSEENVDKKWTEKRFEKIYNSYLDDKEFIAKKSWDMLKSYMERHREDVHEKFERLKEEHRRYKEEHRRHKRLNVRTKDLEDILLKYNMKATNLSYIAIEAKQVRGISEGWYDNELPSVDKNDENEPAVDRKNEKGPDLNLYGQKYVKVYEDKMVKTGKSVCVKLVKYGESSQNTLNPEEYFLRLCREVYLMQTFKHPLLNKSVSAYHDEKNEIVFIVMKLYDGELKKIFRKPIEIRMRVFLQIVEGIGFLHKNRVVHRDIKPENIFLVSESDTIVIGDFGFSTIYELNGGSNVGTLYYKCDELREEYRFDVFSAAIILRQIWDGVKKPFELWPKMNFRTGAPKKLEKSHDLDDDIRKIAQDICDVCWNSETTLDLNSFYCSVLQLKNMVESNKVDKHFDMGRWRKEPEEYAKFPWMQNDWN